jgi:hypothetical protein
METAKYEERVGKRRSLDVTLSAAVAMSGAALAPSMGRMTIAPLRFLLALGNVRLGVWMPNPRRLRKSTRWLPDNPRPRYLVNEIIGSNRIDSHYLYITDGGHYENLGLVELLRRGCTCVFCFDAAGGSVDRYATLGQAIALARAELNVDVSIDPTSMRPGQDRIYPKDHVLGAIAYPPDATYPNGRRGRIVFAKAALTAQAPWDVRAYGERDSVFPADPTVEQLYTGERFEAYRNLGAVAARGAIQSVIGQAVSDLLGGQPPPTPDGAANGMVRVVPWRRWARRLAAILRSTA